MRVFLSITVCLFIFGGCPSEKKAETECSSFATKELCAADTCIWNSVGSLCERKDKLCNFYNSEETCVLSGCFWEKNQCVTVISSLCSNYTEKETCEKADCAWQGGICTKISANFCERLTDQPSCEKLSTCIFDKAARKCLTRATAKCSNLSKEQCFNENCHYDAAKTSCIDSSGFQNCFRTSTKNACEAADCVWLNRVCVTKMVRCASVSGSCPVTDGCESVDNICRAPRCKTNKSSVDCEIELGCRWDKGVKKIGYNGACVEK